MSEMVQSHSKRTAIERASEARKNITDRYSYLFSHSEIIQFPATEACALDKIHIVAEVWQYTR